MIHPEHHHILTRYMRTPLVDCANGPPPTHKALRLPDDQLGIFRDRAVKTVCAGVFDNPAAIPAVFTVLADGGHLIAGELSEECRKAIRKKYRVQTFEDGPFWIVKKLSGPPGEHPRVVPKAAGERKKVFIVRYGALGDHLMVSPLIQHYHDEGWHITYNCTEKGELIYRGDPRIDDLWVQEGNIIPPDKRLFEYWDKLKPNYDHFVNLSESIEGDLLRIEGRANFLDPWEKRAIECSGNYYDAHFRRAGLDITGRVPAIYLSDKEREWARQEVDKVRRQLGKSSIVLWNTLGSSFHKAYPWMHDVWFLIDNNRDDIGIVAVADGAGGFLTGKEHRCVYNAGGKYKIRQSLSLHSAVDAVVTPETWSIVAGMGFDAPVVGLLSDSSKSNFPARPQDVLLTPPLSECPCYPCHQLHYSRISCPPGQRVKSATLCMDALPPGDVYQTLLKIRAAHGNVSDPT